MQFYNKNNRLSIKQAAANCRGLSFNLQSDYFLGFWIFACAAASLAIGTR